jgi:hypothetical protein
VFPSRPWKALLSLCLALLAGASCCPLGLRWLSRVDANTLALSPEPSPDSTGGARADLGTALIPDSTPPEAARTLQWRVAALSPPEHQVGYGLGESLTRSIEHAHQDYGRRLRFRPLGPDRFTYHAPPGCQMDMRCIYDELMRSNAQPVRALGERFVEYIRARRLSADEASELITTFVQRIHYTQPEDQPFGILPPALVPAQDRGDCDSKALLAVMLLRQAGIEAAVLYSDPLSHAAVGVALPGRGPTFHYAGRAYRYVEITSEGWPLGMIPPQHDKPHLWKVLPPPDLSLQNDSAAVGLTTPGARGAP